MKPDFDNASFGDHDLRRQFLHAAEMGAVDIARGILYQGVLNPETLDRALGIAAGEGQAGFVKFLVGEVQMDISRAGPEVLAQAVREREVTLVDILTQHPDLRLTPASALEHHYLDLALVGSAPYSGALLQLLLDRGAAPVCAGFDAINTALREGNGDALQRFLRKDPKVAERLGEKLTEAAMRLDPEAVEMLLQNGAKATHGQNAPLRGLLHQMLDTKGRDPDRISRCAQLLLGAHLVLSEGGCIEGLKQETLKAALTTKNGALIHYLLDAGADIEPQMRGIGYNKMVLAAAYGFNELVDKFYRAGKMEPEAYAEALGVAAETGNLPLVDQMLKYDVEASHTDLVFCAVVGGQVELVTALLARGYTTDFKEPVLLEAVVEGNHGPMLDYLFDQGADRNRAHELYVKVSNRDGKPYGEIHKALKDWSERAETVIYAIPDFKSLDELRTEEMDHRGHPTTLLVRLAKINRFRDAAELARAAVNDRLEMKDLLATDGAGNSVLEILGARGQLPLLFTADLWEKRQDDFAALYGAVAPVYKNQVDCQALTSAWLRQSLARAKLKIPKLRK